MTNTKWILLAATVVVTFFGLGTNGLSSTSDREARKLFGGYRITPKFCKASKSLPKTDPRSHGPTICMFNHECSQRQGQVVGACMDGFLFGACCQLPGVVETTLTQTTANDEHPSNVALASSYESYGENSGQHSTDNKWQSTSDNDQQQPNENYSGNQSPQNSYYESVELESHVNQENNDDGNQIFVSEMSSNTQPPSISNEIIASDELVEISSMAPSLLNNGDSSSEDVSLMAGSSTSHFGIITKDDFMQAHPDDNSFSPELPTHIPAVASLEDSSSMEMDGPIPPTAASDTFTSSGHISSTMMHSDTHLFDSEFTQSGITHPGADTVLIEKLDKEDASGMTADAPTTSTTTERSRVTYAKPVFKPKPKPTVASDGESGGQYVLVHTITKPDDHSQRPTINQNHVESIESIILMLNETKTGPQYDTVSSTEHNYSEATDDDQMSSVTQSSYPSSTLDYNNYGSSSFYITTKNPEAIYSTSQIASSSYDVVSEPSNIGSAEVQTTAASTYGASGSTYNHVSTASSSTHKPTTIVKVQQKPYNEASTIKPATRPRPTATNRPANDEILITPPSTKKNATRKPGTKRPVVKLTTKVPSTSYVTGNPTKKPTTVLNNSSTNQIYPSGPTRRPAVTGASSKPTTHNVVTLVTKRPPSTSYVYSPNPTKRPSNKNPSPTKVGTSTASPTTQDAESVFSSTTDNVKIEQVTQAQLLGQGVAQNTRPSLVTINNYEMIYGISTESPSPTVHITPKPTIISHPSTWTTAASLSDEFSLPSNTPSTSYVYNSIVTNRPIQSSTPLYGGQKVPDNHEFDDPGYYGPSSPAPGMTISTTSFYAPNGDNQNHYGSSPGYQQNYPQYPSVYQGYPGYYGSTPQYPQQAQVNDGIEYSTLKDETYTSPDDLNNFPPVRNPNLNMSANVPPSNADYEFSTPAFVEDEVLNNKMGLLVNKIVASLQEDFDELGDMVEDTRNKTAPQSDSVTTVPTTTLKPVATKKPVSVATKKPIATTKKPVTRRPTTKVPATSASATNPPQRVTTKRPTVTVTRPAATNARPVTTRRPTGNRITTTVRPRPATNTTRRPTKRPATTIVTTTRPAQRISTTTRKPTTRPVKIQTTTLLDELIDEEESEEEEEEEEEDVGEETEEEVVTPSLGEGRIHCGVRPHVKSGRIVGGKGATFGEWPWQVLVRESTWLGLFTKNKCGGVLISNNYVITAAHCQPGFLATLVAVFGEFDISGERETKRSITKNVKRVVVHRNYDAATFENDLALLELESPIHYDTHIVPICMPPNDADFTGRMATVTGWGRLKYGGGVPSVLQEVQVPVIENSVCQEMFSTAGHNKKILPSFLCAGYANGQKDSCEGDSGGPLVMQRPDGRWQLAGTVSHGIKCAAPYLPGVYMRTTFYKPWMQSVTGIK